MTYINTLIIPTVPSNSATIFTSICGLFPTRIVQIKNTIVPSKNASMFQGYAAGPTLLRVCPAIMNTAPTHCKISFSFNHMLQYDSEAGEQ
jgi:hypothetical protein